MTTGTSIEELWPGQRIRLRTRDEGDDYIARFGRVIHTNHRLIEVFCEACQETHLIDMPEDPKECDYSIEVLEEGQSPNGAQL